MPCSPPTAPQPSPRSAPLRRPTPRRRPSPQPACWISRPPSPPPAATLFTPATPSPPPEAVRLPSEALPRRTGPVDADLREAAERLASGPSSALGDPIADAWRHRAAALAAYRTRLDRQQL